MEALDRVTQHASAPAHLEVVSARLRSSMDIPRAFFAAEADRIAQACWQMARRFHQGGRLIAFGSGAWASDAQHVSVEFVHPVIVGKRALPAIALSNESALLGRSARVDAEAHGFERQLGMLAREQDIAMGFSTYGQDPDIVAALEKARRRGLLTIGMTGAEAGRLVETGLDFCFSVPDHDAMVVQETHETLYHILWELVHVFFEHEGLLK